MNKINKTFYLFISIIFIISLALFQTGAVSEGLHNKIYNNKGGIISVSHRGDSVSFPKNSLEAVLSAAKKGADIVSISVQKTKDGIFVLCENSELSSVCNTDKKNVSELTASEILNLHLYDIDGSLSEYTVRTLEELLNKLKETCVIIDNCWEFRSEIFELCKKCKSENRCFIRTDESSKKIAEYLKSDEDRLPVIGVYKGNIVFNVQSHLKRLSENRQIFVQYQSKNYFNVSYNRFTAKKYSFGNNARAIAPMYEKDLCGQRNDNSQGWDEMIDIGFSVIETNNIDSLKKYIADCKSEKGELIRLIEKAENVDVSLYSQGSVKSFNKAFENAQSCKDYGNSSLGKIQSSNSALLESMKNLTLKSDGDVQKGTLNVTTGKVIAAVVFGLLILAGEIYVYKMQKTKV